MDKEIKKEKIKKEKIKKKKQKSFPGIRKTFVISWINLHGIENKKLFEKTFPDLNYSDTKLKWKKVWDPGLQKAEWNDKYDFKLFKYFLLYNGNWKQIKEEFKDRSILSIRNRIRNAARRVITRDYSHLFKMMIFEHKLREPSNFL
jgi:hypothetical protein